MHSQRFAFFSRRLALLLAAAAATLALGGCATGPQARDPFERFNRGVNEFNENVDAVVLKPVATAYKQAVPPLARTGISNVFGNLSDAWSAVNSALQLKLHHAGENWLRVGVNTVFGLGGLLDVATELGIERHREDFGQTLGRWGVPTGPYLVLPILGPSTVRDALAVPIDRQGDLVRQIYPEGTRHMVDALRIVNVRANVLRATSVLDEVALDRYTFTRDAHLQRRRAEVFESRDEDDAPPADPAEPPAAAPAAGPPAAAPAR